MIETKLAGSMEDPKGTFIELASKFGQGLDGERSEEFQELCGTIAEIFTRYDNDISDLTQQNREKSLRIHRLTRSQSNAQTQTSTLG